MIRKWEWVREYCTLHGYEKSAEIADQIDRVLCCLYGDVDTDGWVGYLNRAGDGIVETGEIMLSNVEVMNNIVRESDFCIACRCEEGCRTCRFGELVGICGPGSLFAEFGDRYWEESGY